MSFEMHGTFPDRVVRCSDGTNRRSALLICLHERSENVIVVVFRSRLQPEAEPAYKAMAGQLVPLAQSTPGYIAHKTYIADDGERVTIVEYESEESLLAWSRHPDHVLAKRAGVAEFFSEYRVQICALKRERRSR